MRSILFPFSKWYNSTYSMADASQTYLMLAYSDRKLTMALAQRWKISAILVAAWITTRPIHFDSFHEPYYDKRVRCYWFIRRVEGEEGCLCVGFFACPRTWHEMEEMETDTHLFLGSIWTKYDYSPRFTLTGIFSAHSSPFEILIIRTHTHTIPCSHKYNRAHTLTHT